MRSRLGILAVLALALLAGCGPTPLPTFGLTAPAPAPAAAASAGSALDALGHLAVKGRAPMTGGPLGDYKRSRFAPGWEDPDGNGCDARRDALARQAVGQPVRAGTHGCVTSATVHDPYTGTDIPSGKADIDHVVSLGDAWATGAQQIPATGLGSRYALANDSLNLLAVTASLNRSKGDGDAATWLPPAGPGYRCPYVARQLAVKIKYNLWVTAAERDAMARVLATCPAQPVPTT